MMIMVTVTIVVAGISMAILYQTAFERQRAHLSEVAQSQARLLEAVARFDSTQSGDYPGGAAAATVSQMKDAHTRYQGFGETGEFTLARKEGNFIRFILTHRHSDLDDPIPVPLDAWVAEPMRRALAGQSGTDILPDYRGAQVLAAYEPISLLDLGIVAKIDLSEINAPFIRAAGIAATIGLVLILIGGLIFVRVGNPIVMRLAQSEARYRHLFESAEISVWEEDYSRVWIELTRLRSRGTVDLREYFAAHPAAVLDFVRLIKINSVNDATMTMFGSSFRNGLVPTVEETLVNSEIADFVEEFCAIWDGDDRFSIETTRRTLGGERKSVILSMPVPKSVEQSRSIPVSFFDITERKEMERTTQQAQKMESLGSLAGGIAHDINNMLVPILNITDTVAQSLPPSASQRQHLTLVTKAAQQIKTLVSKILAFSRHEKSEMRAVELAEVVHEAIDLIKLATPSTVQLKFELEHSLCQVYSDKTQIVSAVINLASNAIDAMEGEVGKLGISLSTIEVDDALAEKVVGLNTGNYAKLTVSDTGSGMDEKTMRRVFDPFFTTKNVGEGTGMGLAMVYGIVSNHGGAVEITSAVGHGTTTIIYMPLMGNCATAGQNFGHGETYTIPEDISHG
jgi:signal transduction histidine kinase